MAASTVDADLMVTVGDTDVVGEGLRRCCWEPGAPPVESCTQAATVIESYLYPSRTGRMAAHGGHTRASGGRTVKMNVPYVL